MKVLVTGATGFIGSHLVQRLTGAGAEVRALVRESTDASRLEAAGVEVLRGDLRDPEALRRSVADREVIYHLAKAPSGSPSRTLRTVNVEGTAGLARAAAAEGVTRLVHASTAAVYGGIVRGSAVREDAALNPESSYARSKALAERRLRSSGDRHAVPIVIARICSVLGPGGDGMRGLFASVASGRFRLIGAGDNRHHLADVSDIVEGLLLCGSQPGIEGRIYNLAGGEPILIRDLVLLIGQELGVEGPPKSLPAAPLAVYRRLSQALSRIAGVGLPRADGIATLMSDRVLDISRARRELGYAPRVGVEESVRRTAAWYGKSRSASRHPERGKGAARRASGTHAAGSSRRSG